MGSSVDIKKEVSDLRGDFILLCKKHGLNHGLLECVSFAGDGQVMNDQHFVIDFVDGAYCLFYFERGRASLSESFRCSSEALRYLVESVCYSEAVFFCKKNKIPKDVARFDGCVNSKQRELVRSVSLGWYEILEKKHADIYS